MEVMLEYLSIREQERFHMTTIEHGIKPWRKRTKTKSAYPFDGMAIDDSFFIAGNPQKIQKLICQAIHNYNIKHPEWHFTVLQTDDGARCFRLPDHLTEDNT